jgi:hypothetical protein
MHVMNCLTLQGECPGSYMSTGTVPAEAARALDLGPSPAAADAAHPRRQSS